MKQHPGVKEAAQLYQSKKINRRDFVRQATLLGVSLSGALAMAAKLGGEVLAPKELQAATKGKKGGHLRCSMRVMEVSDPAVFDWTEKANVIRHSLEYLTHIDSDNNTVPWLCEKWEASADLKTWTLYLRKGVKWSNGDSFTAEDVVYNFKRWLDPKVGSSNQGLFSGMITKTDTGKKDKNGNPIFSKTMTPGAVERIDDHTVRLNLNSADLAIPESLSSYPAAILHRDFDKEGGNWMKNPVGTGPFQLESIEVGQKAVLTKRNPKDYWGEEVFLNKITYIDLGDEATASLSALQSGQVDLVQEAFIEQLEVLERMPHIAVYSSMTAQTAVARMQISKKPFDNPLVREAICLCQDHEKLSKLAYRGKGVPAEDHHVSPIHPEYFPLPKVKQDQAKAKKLLAKAGYPKGIEVSIDVRKEPPWELAAVQAFAEMCKPAGIKIKINVMPSAQYWEIWDTTAFGFTSWTHRPLGIMVLNLGYRSGTPWNETHYNNPEFDKALDDASGTFDILERKKKMEKVEKILQKDHVIAQPFWRPVFTAFNKRVKNFQGHPVLYHDFRKVYLD